MTLLNFQADIKGFLSGLSKPLDGSEFDWRFLFFPVVWVASLYLFFRPQSKLLNRNKKIEKDLASFLKENTSETLKEKLDFSLGSLTCYISMKSIFERLTVENISFPQCSINVLVDLDDYGIFINGIFNVNKIFPTLIRGGEPISLPKLFPLLLLLTKDQDNVLRFNSTFPESKEVDPFFKELVYKITAAITDKTIN